VPPIGFRNKECFFLYLSNGATGSNVRQYVTTEMSDNLYRHFRERPSHTGKRALMDPDRKPEPGYPVIVKLANAPEAVFKMLELYDGKLHLKPLNPIYRTAPMPDDARIVGVVVSRQVDTLTDAFLRPQASQEVTHAYS
jgi:hypothetical protein